MTLDFPVYSPFMRYGKNRALREEFHKAYTTVATAEPWDNGPIMEEILVLRSEMASMLGFPSYAHLSIARKSAPSVEAVYDVYKEVLTASRSVALSELEKLGACARAEGDGCGYTIGTICKFKTVNR
jgi:oligopeptidase A